MFAVAPVADLGEYRSHSTALAADGVAVEAIAPGADQLLAAGAVAGHMLLGGAPAQRADEGRHLPDLMVDHLPGAGHLRVRNAVSNDTEQRRVIRGAGQGRPGQVRAFAAVARGTVTGRAVTHKQLLAAGDVG